MQMQEWTFGPNGRLDGLAVKDALITGNIPSPHADGARTKELLATDPEKPRDWMKIARTISLQRDPSD